MFSQNYTPLILFFCLVLGCVNPTKKRGMYKKFCKFVFVNAKYLVFLRL